ncbi:MAG: DUF1016 family protein [Eubacterium sp.]|nr:DUF1016 family protein [Eubacterium sp.]
MLSFDILVETIKEIHQSAQTTAVGAINRSMTLRNWLIGYYIVEFEQHGEERAVYGDRLLKKLEERVDEKGLNNTLFKNCRRFYLVYPQIGQIFSKNQITATVKGLLPKSPTASDFLEMLPEKSPMTSDQFMTKPEELISKLSFSHIVELLPISDPFERFFYEFECIRSGWNVKELRRQIATTLYFRAGISKNPEKLLEQMSVEQPPAVLSIKDPFSFEFLGLDAKETVTESDVENALVDHLQEFLLEMGKGFCFEARQKRIIIDDEYYFIDLVLYNRILHCNVIIELKDDKFTHENFGQLNAYVAYYKENEMHPGDNPPVGILLCTKKGPKMVEYALSGMDNQLFVSTYMLQIPGKEQLKDFLIKQMEEIGYDQI